MITKLTKEQEARFPEFVEKWTRIGLSTEPANRPEAENGIFESYAAAGLSVPKIVWCSSPIAQGLTRAILFNLPKEVRASVGASVGDSVGASVGASGYGQHDANWIGFYSFFRAVLNLAEETEKLNGLTRVCENAGWFLPHKNLCWIAERHNVVHRNSRGQLHKDGSMALSYPDGWGIYALNGIRMTPAQVLTPAENISPESVLEEKNADRRRELIRKVGIERMLAKLPHKSMDRRGDYELLSIHLSEQVTDARFLKMLNPSMGVFHLEGVDPSCKTVGESLNWRNSQWHEEAEILT